VLGPLFTDPRHFDEQAQVAVAMRRARWRSSVRTRCTASEPNRSDRNAPRDGDHLSAERFDQFKAPGRRDAAMTAA